MKLRLIIFAVAFLLGFFGVSTRHSLSSEQTTSVPELATTGRTSARIDDSFSEFEALMLDPTEKIERLVDKANDLSSLLGLAEKLWAEFGSEYGGIPDEVDGVIHKLAKLYPTESLRYYATMPSNAQMNQLMSGKIARQWISLDCAAYLTYIDQDESLSISQFCDLWKNGAGEMLPEKSTECAQIFLKLTKVKQQELIENLDGSGLIARALLPVIVDPAMLAKAQKTVDDANNTAKSEILNSEEEKMTALEVRIKTSKLEPKELAVILDEMPDSNDRKRVLHMSIEPSEEERNDPSSWLARIETIFAHVDDITHYPPRLYTTDDKAYNEALEQWLPSQSPRLQRAWADDLIDEQTPAEALSWAEKLSTASLRKDMREYTMKSWTNRDPQQAAKFISTNFTTEEKAEMLPQAVYKWALKDYSSARQWLDEQAESAAISAALRKIENK